MTPDSDEIRIPAGLRERFDALVARLGLDQRIVEIAVLTRGIADLELEIARQRAHLHEEP